MNEKATKQDKAIPKKINKIVITGGPCAGKTTALSWIQSNMTKIGYTVLFIPETATELIGGGIAPWTLRTNLDFQKSLFSLQRHKEKIFEKVADNMDSNNLLIVCDRGLLDNKAYMTETEFSDVLTSSNTNEIDVRDNYDAVFHLVTAANGAEEYYTLANNKARTETVEEAVAIDNRLIDSWTGHPHLRVIGNTVGFEQKLTNLMREINSFLGEPNPYEIERKYMIDFPDLVFLNSLKNCTKVEIIQTYLVSDEDGTETRVRQRGKEGNYVYYKTVKRKISDIKRIETEERLTKDQYLSYLMDADTSLRQIRKTRYCLSENGLYYEIDIYPFWSDKAILEVELLDENQKIVFPDFIKVIKEVTADEKYMNYSLAKNLPEEA